VNPSIQAAVFDMDGLMLDTERVGRYTFEKATADFGITVGDDVYVQMIGRNWQDSKQIMMAALGPDFPFDELRLCWRKHAEAHIDSYGVPCKPGLLELLDLLETRGVPKAVATSTRRERAHALLEKLSLRHRFHTVIGGDEVEKGKPDPEIFLRAAERLAIDPQHCVVFEDSGPGIRAAHAAGMIPILVPDLVPPSDDVRQLAHRIYNSLDEACALFG
jgi:HAD superfamily hydrolase (TIGR01509 family)